MTTEQSIRKQFPDIQELLITPRFDGELYFEDISFKETEEITRASIERHLAQVALDSWKRINGRNVFISRCEEKLRSFQ